MNRAWWQVISVPIALDTEKWHKLTMLQSQLWSLAVMLLSFWEYFHLVAYISILSSKCSFIQVMSISVDHFPCVINTSVQSVYHFPCVIVYYTSVQSVYDCRVLLLLDNNPSSMITSCILFCKKYKSRKSVQSFFWSVLLLG